MTTKQSIKLTVVVLSFFVLITTLASTLHTPSINVESVAVICSDLCK